MSYVSVLLNTLKRLKSVMPSASSDSGSDSLSLAPSPKETDSKQKLHRDNIKTIRFKAAIEDTIKDLETKKLEEEATKRRKIVTKLVNEVEEGTGNKHGGLFILLVSCNRRQNYFSLNCVYYFLHPLLKCTSRREGQ